MKPTKKERCSFQRCWNKATLKLLDIDGDVHAQYCDKHAREIGELISLDSAKKIDLD